MQIKQFFKITSISCTLMLLLLNAHAQSYEDTILLYRQKLKVEFLTKAKSPIGVADTALLDYFAPDKSYIFETKFVITPGMPVFNMPTSSGKSKPYRQYGYLTFMFRGKEIVLKVYQSMDLLKDKKLRNYLFLPFRDYTNSESTYGGGRYMSLSQEDILNGKLILDFNKAYNPYCAYKAGYSCPITPAENLLPFKLNAGEKMFRAKE